MTNAAAAGAGDAVQQGEMFLGVGAVYLSLRPPLAAAAAAATTQLLLPAVLLLAGAAD